MVEQDAEIGDEKRQEAQDNLVGEAASVFTGELIELLDGK